jgi:hypothetical protein
MHPLWQLKQIITTGYPTKDEAALGVSPVLKRRVDRRMNFGNAGSPRGFLSFSGCTSWIAREIRGITDLYSYMDDFFSWDKKGRVAWYAPYNKFMPEKQVQLLLLWDELGIQHKEKKQLFGEVLVIIGFQLDINTMTLTLPDEAKTDLLAAVAEFPAESRRSLQEWQQLAGWMSWSLNVFPRLRPALSSVYQKMEGKEQKRATIYVNEAVKADLDWFASHVRSSSGILAFSTLDWNPLADADFQIRCDACLEGMGFWAPSLCLGSYCAVPPGVPEGPKIFFWESLTVLAALEWFELKVQNIDTRTSSLTRPVQLTIMTDNMNTVQIFDSLAAGPGYNDILKAAMDICIAKNIDLRVLHIPGVDNSVADAISRRKFADAQALVPTLQISTFKPPRCTLGAARK